MAEIIQVQINREHQIGADRIKVYNLSYNGISLFLFSWSE